MAPSFVSIAMTYRNAAREQRNRDWIIRYEGAIERQGSHHLNQA
jgi:hypothetical protein